MDLGPQLLIICNGPSKVEQEEVVASNIADHPPFAIAFGHSQTISELTSYLGQAWRARPGGVLSAAIAAQAEKKESAIRERTRMGTSQLRVRLAYQKIADACEGG